MRCLWRQVWHGARLPLQQQQQRISSCNWSTSAAGLVAEHRGQALAHKMSKHGTGPRLYRGAAKRAHSPCCCCACWIAWPSWRPCALQAAACAASPSAALGQQLCGRCPFQPCTQLWHSPACSWLLAWCAARAAAMQGPQLAPSSCVPCQLQGVQGRSCMQLHYMQLLESQRGGAMGLP